VSVAAVELRDVFRVHSTPEGDAAALQGLSLTVSEREVLTVLGPSGSGKTTLLRILAALDRPSAGVVRVFGTEVGKLPQHRAAAYRAATLGYADQHYSRALAAELPARELVGVQLGLRGTPRRERLRRAEELLERVGLADRSDARPGELSGGEQQRVAVCAALAHRPRLLLADEPTGELDHANADRLYALIGELAREQGCTTVLVSHDPESAAIADRIVRIRDGRLSEEFVREGGAGDTIVVGRGGWLRVPEELLARAGIASRATATLERGRVVIERAATSTQTRSSPDVSSRLAPSPPGGAARAPAETVASFDSRVCADSATNDAHVAELRAVSKRYGRQSVLERLDAVFERGKLHVVTGPSGSGKTTLLHLLAGLELPEEGAVHALGTDVSALGRAARAAFRRGAVGYVGQQPGLTPFLSARENVELGLAIRGVDPVDARLRALEALDAVALDERAEQLVSRLSTGERGRVAIARALAVRPALLLADEPTSRLDQANALAVGTLFARLARESGTTIVCATHDPVVIEQADEELRLG
jgi:ABC-type lipoprotein export system ATPase subunit